MDLLNRRTSTAASRRGTLLPGGARRNATSGEATGGSNEAKNTAGKTALLAEFRAHEEDQAARVLQRAAKVYLSRKFVAKLLLQVYRRQYDPIEKQYFYVNTNTNETTWERPLALDLFLSDAQDVPVLVASGVGKEISAGEAAKRIQRATRAFLAKRLMQRLVRENYMKLFDSATKTFYYLNTRTGESSPEKPLFLGKVENNDIPVETFSFRKAVCKVSSSTNLYGSGVLGYFGVGDSTHWLCLLSDSKTLSDTTVAATAHVVCNFAPDGGTVPFEISLRPDKFFAAISLDAAERFALCAVDRDSFLGRAGTNLQPLRLKMNDRKLGCVDATRGGIKLHDYLEVVGHPHGKPRVVHTRSLAKMIPHSIAPVTMQFNRETESGSSGSAVFTRGGKLLGLQHFTPLKEQPPLAFYYIRPILDEATALVTPPEPFLLTTCLASCQVHVCWSIVRWFKALPGLAIEFELELCRHETTPARGRHSFEKFEPMYRGNRRSKCLDALTSETLYSVRVRACNPMAKSKWSSALTFRTPPTPSLAWRITKYCTSIRDACARMRQQRGDATAQLSGIRWITRHLDQRAGEQKDLQEAEREFVDAQGLDWVLVTALDRFPGYHELVLLSLRLLTKLVDLHRRIQQLLSQVASMGSLLVLLQRHLPQPMGDQQEQSGGEDEPVSDGMEIPQACVVLLGSILDGDNPSGQQSAQALDVVSMLLAILSSDDNRLLQHAPFVADCTFLFARFTHNHTHGAKWQFVENGRLRVLRDILEIYATNGASTILYWTLLTISNIAYGCVARDELEREADALHLVMAVCTARMQFLLRVNELELVVGAAQREFARLTASVMGDDMRNEMDACEHEIATMTHAVEELHTSGDVALAGDFALRYLLTEDQKRVQQASQRLMRKFLLRTSASAFTKWLEATIFERHCAIMRAFLTTVRHRQLGAAFRKWEQFLRAWRQQHKSAIVQAVLGAGLAIDLNKNKKERYRMLVLQK